MNNLFEFNGKEITINPILLSIKEFEKIWKRDKSKDKSKARKELTYIYGMSSNNEDNIWGDYVDLQIREKEIISDLFEEEWYPDQLVSEAIAKYKLRYPKSAAEELLESTKVAMLKVKTFLEELNLNDVDDNGRLKHNPKIILELAKQSTDTYIKIEETIEKIQSNKKLQAERLRGGGDIGMFEEDEGEIF